ncbi:helix-turn-helix domain-containing protein [Acinetobacter baumannii]|uniref:helix-turn-helix domain-containing protein n=1 Tax=Acinetobacter baumannii TaxID=470 RepID=UPI0026FAB287|nr:helix-turn-helix domain-containing protein [Acinetobacter baumannii]MDO7392233.1 helix-turn-helix domain-containing protein [Acinetobacter baumannii]MDV4231038.1 helix-turn-helix domain-containing protein [Acinetobacter baumannii]HEO1774362.1 helix-turn-helix domain-containing protein [Acinetobacter baumannii]
MSLDATLWAWKAPVNSATQRLVLVSLADRAGEDFTCYPSAERLHRDTLLNRKTILKVISDLIELGLVLDTGKKIGNGVRVLKLVGVDCRENQPTSTEIGTGTKIGTGTEIGIPTNPKNGTSTHPNFGIQNLPMNLPKNLPREKTEKSKAKNEYSENFEKFWSAYPTCKRKSDKSGTYKTFTKHEGSFAIETLLSILEKQKSDVSWTKQDGEFIPSPSTWLNQKQWENEYWFQVNSSVVAPDFSNAQLQYGDW